MTVPSSTSRDQQAGNGIATVFTVPFRILDQTHIRVLVTAADGTTTEQVLTTDYAASDVGGTNTTITFVTAPAASTTITFLRNVPLTQETDYAANDSFPAQSHEDALDKQMMALQQLAEVAGEGGRTIKIPAETSGVSTELPPPEASVLWGWNAARNAPRYFTPTEIATEVAYAEHHAENFTATPGQTDFTIAADPGSLGNLDVSIDGVTQVNGVDFTYSGTTVTFAAPMVGGEVVLILYGEALPTGVTNASAVNFDHGGAGSVVRTVEDRLTEVISILDFGADPTGITDSTAAIQNAIDAAGTYAEVFFPAGIYTVSSTIVIARSRIHLRGAGHWQTWIHRQTDYGDTFLFTGDDLTGTLISDVGLSGMSMRSTALTTSGAFVCMNGVTHATVRDLYLLNGFIGFHGKGLTAAYISNTYTVFTNMFGGSSTGRRYAKFSSAAATYGHPSCGDVFIDNFNWRGNTANNIAEYGCEINSGDGIWFDSGHIGNTATANLAIIANDTVHIGLIYFDNVLFDACLGLGVLFAGSTAIGRNIAFTGCGFKGGGTGTTGVQANASATFNNVQFSNCFVTEYNSHGVSFNATCAMQNVDFIGCQVRGNSYTANNTAEGYNLSGGANVRILGGRVGGHNIDPTFASQRYAIAVGAAATDVMISDVDLTGNATGSLSINAASIGEVQVRDCLTQESTTITAAATITLPHNGDSFTISGNTNITSVTASYPGRRVSLMFTGTPTFTDGSNLKLNGNLVATADDTISLCCFDGVNWYETGRSVN